MNDGITDATDFVLAIFLLADAGLPECFRAKRTPVA
jgi:hypothetical protein